MRQYEMFELSFQGQSPENGADAPLWAEFTGDGFRTAVRGFYDGNGIYKIRFYPKFAGTCSWKVESVVTLEGALEGKTYCHPAREHGMVQVNGVHFRYEDGNRYVPIGTTVYALIHQVPALIEQTMETLRRAPFNKVRLCVFPKSYSYNQNEPELFAFDRTGGRIDVKKPNSQFWDRLENIIIRLRKMNIEADIILFHPYDRWGFARLSKEECLTYLDYTVRRLSAFPNVWWSLANEYDLMEHFPETWWYDFAAFLRERDPYGHLLSNHNSLPYWDFADPNITHCCIQDSRMKQIPNLQTAYQKPVIFDECCYEGNIPQAWGNLSGFELVHRFWTAYTVGGYCSHGETFTDPNDILWWAKGGTLHGQSPARIAFLRSIMEELPGDLDSERDYMGFLDAKRLRDDLRDPDKAAKISTFEKAFAKMPEDRLPELVDRFRQVRGRCGTAAFLVYYGRQCPAMGTMELPEVGNYQVEVIDIWEMSRKIILENVHGRVQVPLPGKEGIAVLAKRFPSI